MGKYSWKKLVSLFASIAILLSLVGCSVEIADIGDVTTEVTTVETVATKESASEGTGDETEAVDTDDETDESVDESILEDTQDEELVTEDTSISEENVIIEETESTEATTEATESFYVESDSQDLLDVDGVYTSKDDVSLYIYQYGELPSNFMTKKDAKALGWTGGSLEAYAPGMCIGGDYFGNYEGLLPEKKGRDYHECDINTLGAKSRGAERIIFSNDGLIYYTEDHYESFTLLYGEE